MSFEICNDGHDEIVFEKRPRAVYERCPLCVALEKLTAAETMLKDNPEIWESWHPTDKENK